MFDIVFPKDNEEEFIRLATILNFDGLYFVYEKPRKLDFSSDIKIKQAILCNPDNIRKYKGKYPTIMIAPEDQSKIRHVIEQCRPDILIGLEFSRRPDFMHHRASGLNHVMSKIAKEKNVAVGFDFASILQKRTPYLGRFSQNIRLAKKYSFKTIIASFARSPYQMRSKNDITSLFETLGMPKDMIKVSFGVLR